MLCFDVLRFFLGKRVSLEELVYFPEFAERGVVSVAVLISSLVGSKMEA